MRFSFLFCLRIFLLKDYQALLHVFFLNILRIILNIWYRVWSLWQFQEQPSRGVLRKRCSENMQQIYWRTTMPKCDFKTAALQLYWNRTSAWVFFCKFATYFQNTFSYEHLWMAASVIQIYHFTLELIF